MPVSSYWMNDDGLYYEEAYIANFRISPVSKIRKLDLDGNIIDIQYNLQAEFPDGNKGEIISVKNYKNLDFSSLWEQCIDAALSPKQKKMLLEDLQINLQNKEWEEITVLTRTGLINKNPVVYVYSKDVIIQENSSISYTTAGNIPSLNIKTPVKTYTSIYLENLLTFYPTVTDVLLLIHLLAQLKPLLNSMGEPVDCMAFISGKSRSLKTSYADILLVNNPEQMLKFTIDNTKKAKEISRKYNGHCICVDDYHYVNQKYLKDKQNDMLDFLARNANNPDNAFAIATGEYIDGIVSLQDRLIQIYVCKSKEDFDSNQLKSLNNLQKNKHILHYFYYEFAKKVYSDIKQTEETIKNNINELYKHSTGYRIDRNAGLLKIALKVLTNLFPGYINENMFCDIEKSINCITKNQETHMKRAEALEYGADWALIIYNVIDGRQVPEYIPQSSTKQMFIKNDILYITQLALETGLENYLKCKTNTEEAVKFLYKQQLLATDNSNALTVKRDGIRYYAIKTGPLKCYYQQNSHTNSGHNNP